MSYVQARIGWCISSRAAALVWSILTGESVFRKQHSLQFGANRTHLRGSVSLCTVCTAQTDDVTLLLRKFMKVETICAAITSQADVMHVPSSLELTNPQG